MSKALFAALLAVGFTAHAGGLDERLDFSKGPRSLGTSYGRALSDATPAQQNILNLQAAAVELYLTNLPAEELRAAQRMTVRELLIHLLSTRERSLMNAVPEVERFLNGEGLDFDPGAPDYKVSRDGQRATFSLKARFEVRNTSKLFRLTLLGCRLGVGLDDKIYGGMVDANLCGTVPVLAPGATTTMDVRYDMRAQEHAAAMARAIEAGQRTRVTFALLPSRDSIIADGRYNFKLNAEDLRTYKTELSQVKTDIAVMRGR